MRRRGRPEETKYKRVGDGRDDGRSDDPPASRRREAAVMGNRRNNVGIRYRDDRRHCRRRPREAPCVPPRGQGTRGVDVDRLRKRHVTPPARGSPDEAPPGRMRERTPRPRPRPHVDRRDEDVASGGTRGITDRYGNRRLCPDRDRRRARGWFGLRLFGQRERGRDEESKGKTKIPAWAPFQARRGPAVPRQIARRGLARGTARSARTQDAGPGERIGATDRGDGTHIMRRKARP